MNIIQVYCSRTLGGAELQMYEITKRLFKKGINVRLCCPFGSKLFWKAYREGIPVEKLNIIGSLDFVGLLSLYFIIKRYKINLLHIHQGKLLWPSIILKVLLAKKIKVILHRRTTISIKPISRWALNYLDYIIVDSYSVKDVLLKIGVNQKKIGVIHPGVDMRRFNPYISPRMVRERYHLDNYFVIGCIAAMNPPEGKGQKYLIMALSRICETYKNVRLLLVGDGKIRRKLELLSKKLGVQDKVVFAGYQEKIEDFIAAMDIICLPSVGEESFGVVMIEAQAMGKPVIGTNVGGIRETLLCGITGEIVEPKNVEQLVNAILTFLTDKAKYEYASANCRAWVKKNFDIDKVVEKIEEIFKSI